MKPEIEEKWITMLESDEYQQTRGALHDKDGFCCLGLLCELHSKETGTKWKNSGFTRNSEMVYFGLIGVLSPEVQQWAGIESNNIKLVYEGNSMLASELNDQYGLTFKEIAKLVREKRIKENDDHTNQS